uniref:Choline O-acetyltransferase n=2 Tax=Macrostomum lignano TaxID=282301 RepID=A0A1I8IMQ7_9PLAT
RPLPKLPVPELHATLATYLKLVEPVVSEERFANTKRIVQEFLQPGGVGEKLQKQLVETAKTKENWVSDWWLDDMYLLNQLPLPVNSNPGLVFPSTSFESDREQLRFAAQLIVAIFDYKTILDERKLPVERVRHHKKGQPLCMEQYYRLFSSYRRPGVAKDEQVLNLDRDPFDPEYVIVACNDQVRDQL